MIDGDPGDLVFVVKTRDDEKNRIKRVGASDLHMTYEITLIEALNGFSKIFKHYGPQVKIERDGVTVPFDKMTLRGEGLRNTTNSKSSVICSSRFKCSFRTR